MCKVQVILSHNNKNIIDIKKDDGDDNNTGDDDDHHDTNNQKTINDSNTYIIKMIMRVIMIKL